MEYWSTGGAGFFEEIGPKIFASIVNADQVAISDFFDPHYGDRFLCLLPKD
jgi:hypothetical protein